MSTKHKNTRRRRNGAKFLKLKFICYEKYFDEDEMELDLLTICKFYGYKFYIYQKPCGIVLAFAKYKDIIYISDVLTKAYNYFCLPMRREKQTKTARFFEEQIINNCADQILDTCENLLAMLKNGEYPYSDAVFGCHMQQLIDMSSHGIIDDMNPGFE